MVFSGRLAFSKHIYLRIARVNDTLLLDIRRTHIPCCYENGGDFLCNQARLPLTCHGSSHPTSQFVGNNTFPIRTNNTTCSREYCTVGCSKVCHRFAAWVYRCYLYHAHPDRCGKSSARVTVAQQGISHCELALGRVVRESRVEGCLARSSVARHLRAQGLVPRRLPVLLTDST